MSKIWMLALVLAVGACDCGDGDPNPPGDDCEEDADCTDPVSPWCVMERCVQCRDEADCAAGQSCSGTNMCMGDTLDGSMDDTGVVDGGDDSAVECVGAPPACCDTSAGTVDSECVGDTYVCPSGTTEGACVAGPLWSATYGMELDDFVEDIVVDGAGNIYVTGRFLASEGIASPIDFGGGELTAAGGSDGFIASFDADGVYRWAQGFGGTGFDTGKELAVDSSDNIYLVGRIDGAGIDFGGGPLAGAGADAFVASFTSAGAYRWARRMDADSGEAKSVTVDAADNVYVGGSYQGSVDFGGGAAGTAGAFVASYAEDGTYRWAQRFGDNQNTFVVGVAADGAGNVYINGATRELALDFGGGDLDSVGGNQPDQFLASFSATDGSYRWAQRFGDSGSEFGGPIAVDSANNVYMIGGFDSADYGGGVVTKIGDGRDVVLASYDSDGVYRWDVTWDASDARSVVVDASDNVYVTGFFSSDAVDFGGGALANAGGADVYLVSVQPDGTFRFSLGFGPAMNQTGTGVAIDDSGIYLSADFMETIDFGDGEHTGLEDIALVKLPLP